MSDRPSSNVRKRRDWRLISQINICLEPTTLILSVLSSFSITSVNESERQTKNRRMNFIRKQTCLHGDPLKMRWTRSS